MAGETFSFQEAREHYGVWRWRIELDPAVHFGETWAQIGASNLMEAAKIRLLDVAWAEAAFMRAYYVLLEDCWRTEKARNEGVPAVMALLSGSYAHSLERLLCTSLWMDLGEVFIAYRTLSNRIKACRRHVLTQEAVMVEVETLQARCLPTLSPDPVTLVAGQILHVSWDPSGQPSLSMQMFWKPTEPPTVDFADGPFRDSLASLVAETQRQLSDFMGRALSSRS